MSSSADRRHRLPAALAAVLLMAVVATGCGFKLRGSYGVADALQPVYLDAGGDFGRVLERSLAAGGVELADSPDAAASVLNVQSTDRERRVLAIDEDGRANEYELVLRADWSLRASGDDDEARIGSTRYSASRSFFFDPESRLARDDEEEVLIDEIRADLADRILRRIAAWTPDDE